MHRAVLTITAALAAVLVCPGAAAEDQAATGSRLDPAERANPNSSSVRSPATVYRIVQCEVRRRPDKAAAFLGATDAAQAAQEENILLDAGDCDFGWLADPRSLEIQFNATQSVIRGMTAEVLLDRDKGADAMQPLAFQLHYPRSWHALTGRNNAVDEMATCVADIDPQGIRKVLATDFDSAEERAALQALAPEFGKCLQAGYKLEGNPLGLRTALAEALYYRAFHPELTPVVQTKPAR